MRARTLHSPHLPARREADFIFRQRLFLLQGRPTVGRPFVVRPEPGGESAGYVCLQCLVLRAVCLLSPFACHAHCPSQRSCPRSFAPVHCHVRQDHRLLGPAVCQGQQFVFSLFQHVCKLQDCPVGSCNTGLQWRPVHRSIC